MDDADQRDPKRQRSESAPPDAPPSHLKIPYSVSFTDSLIQPLVHPPARNTKASKAGVGVRILAPGAPEPRKKDGHVRLEDIDVFALPEVTQDELPLALDDPRRKYASGVSGVKLTHPGGALEGGPALQDNVAAPDGTEDNADDPYAKFPAPIRFFLREHDISTPEQLRDVVKKEQQKQVEELRKRMAEREEAKKKNEKIEKEIQDLVAEREMERRVHERARRERDGTG